MNKKFTLRLDLKFELGSVTLFRIERYSNKELGGWIEKESNLSQTGNAWVSGNARVSGDAQVYGDAWVYGNALVSGDARVSGNARVSGDAWVYGNARVSGDARVSGNARVSGDALITDKSQIVTVTNLQFDFTVTPQNIAIGCHIFTHEEIKKITRRKALKLGLFVDNYVLYKTLILQLIKYVTRKPTN